MPAEISTDLLMLRLLLATPEDRAAVYRFLVGRVPLGGERATASDPAAGQPTLTVSPGDNPTTSGTTGGAPVNQGTENGNLETGEWQSPGPVTGTSNGDLAAALVGMQQEMRSQRELLLGLGTQMVAVTRGNAELRAANARLEPASDDEARRLFALLKALESESNYRKAPVTRVFQLYCLEGLTRKQVATQCHCVPSLITLRLQAIEAKLGRKASELRLLSDHFERIAESLTEDRARRVHRASALDQPEDEEDC